MPLIKQRKKQKNNTKKTVYLINFIFKFWKTDEIIPIKIVDSQKEAKIFCSSKNFEFQNILFASDRELEDYEQEEDNVTAKENIKAIREYIIRDFKNLSDNQIWNKLDSYNAYDWQYIKYESNKLE